MVSVEEALEFWEIHLKCIREEWDRTSEYALRKDRWADKEILEDLEVSLQVISGCLRTHGELDED